MNDAITKRFVELAIPYYVHMLDALEKYFDARYDRVSSSQRINSLEKEAYALNADLQSVYGGLDETCKEKDLIALRLLDSQKIEKRFTGCYFYFLDDISIHAKPNIELTKKMKKEFQILMQDY